jgi:sarcosine oxidase subunit alpha
MSTVQFTFDGVSYHGNKGEPLSAALLRNGIKVVTESSYRFRPRGVFGLGYEEPCAMVQIDSGSGEPMVPATKIELVDGLVVRSLAGVGDLPIQPDKARYDKTFKHVDVLVIGAGTSGLKAAQKAAQSGKSVIILDDQFEVGGHQKDLIEKIDTSLIKSLKKENVTHLQRTTAIGLYDQNYVVAVERRSDHLSSSITPDFARMRTWHIRAKKIVLATGAFQRILVFPNNDRPGIMLSHAAATYLHKYRVGTFKQSVVVTVDDYGYEDALRIQKSGVKVLAVVDIRNKVSGKLIDKVKKSGIEVILSSTVVDTSADQTGALNSVFVAQTNLDGKVVGTKREIAADLLAVSGGWTPTVHLATYLNLKPIWNKKIAAFVMPNLPSNISATGYANGEFDKVENLPARFFGLIPEGEDAKVSYIDLQRDANVRDLRRAVGAGLTSVEHIKRYTTIGTAHDQGKTSGTTTMGLLAQLINKEPHEVGTLTFRPPYIGVPFSALAGRDLGILSDPIRTTPIHSSHLKAKAPMEDVGQWKRPWYFPIEKENMHDAVLRECRSAREDVAVMDASTLGKIDIQGPDAGIFLDRIYTNMFSTLKVGSSRYGLMCGVDGMVFDDGVTTRISENRFLMTTTTGGAAKVLDWLEEWLQTEWPDLNVYCTSVTEHWSTVAIVGPKSRSLLAKLAPNLDVSNENFPFMENRYAEVAGIPARIARISFSGELAYEINIEAWYGLHIWQEVLRVGKQFNIAAYGTETMHVLRAEKGFVIVGQETDGTQTPQDLAMDWIVSKKKDFIGKRSFTRSDTARPGRHQLVGLLPLDTKELLPEGCYIVNEGDSNKEGKIAHIGYVTSSYTSAALGRTFALAMVANGSKKIGSFAEVPIGKKTARVEIVDSVFFDKENTRRDG